MSEIPHASQTPAAPAPPTKTGWQKYSRWVSGVVGLILLIVGLTRLYGVFFPGLPSCTSDATAEVIRNIFKQKNVEIKKLNGLKTITDASSEKTCQGHVESDKETATIFYRIFWRNKNATVMITKVDAKPI